MDFCRTHWLSRLAMIIASVALPVATFAQSTTEPGDAPADPSGPSLIPRQFLWPGVVVIIVIAIFAAAAVAGPLIRINSEDDGDSEDSEGKN